MDWNGYIKGDGTCLLTPLSGGHDDVKKWWTGSRKKWVCACDGGLEATKTMAGKHGAKRFVLHNPPDVRMTRI